MDYRPSLDAFWGSFFFGLTPALTAGLFAYFAGGTAGAWFWVPSALMFLLSLYLSVQCVLVFMDRLHLDERLIRAAGPLHKVEITWGEVTGAVLRERANPVSRTDRMLVIRSRRDTLIFHTSTLSEADEEEVLKLVRARVSLTVQRDRPAV